MITCTVYTILEDFLKRSTTGRNYNCHTEKPEVKNTSSLVKMYDMIIVQASKDADGCHRSNIRVLLQNGPTEI